MYRFLVLAALAIAPLTSSALCPTEHFEPSANFGEVFQAPSQFKTPTGLAVDFLKQEAEEVLVYFEWGGSSSYHLSLIRRESDGEGVLSLDQLKNGVVNSRHMRISASEVQKTLAEVTPILLRTHYASQACTDHYLDGYIAQMAVASPTGTRSGHGLIAGEVYSPEPNSDAGRAVVIARKLKALAMSTAQR